MSRSIDTGRLALTCVAVSAAMAVCASPAAAQIPGLSSGGRSANLQIRARATYDTNVARGNSVVAAARSVRKDDILYAPSAKVDVVWPVGRQSVFLQGTAGYEFYQFNKKLQREQIALTGGGTGSAGPCQGVLTGGYSRHQSDLADLSVLVTKNTQESTTVGAQASCSIGGGVGGNLSVQRAHLTNSSSVGVVNSDVTSVQTGLSYQNRALGAVSLIAGYSEANYGGQPGILLATNLGFTTRSLGVSYSRPIGTRLQGQAAFSYSTVESSGVAGKSNVGITGSAALSYRASPRLNATLSYQRSIAPSILQGSSYSLQQGLAFDAHYTVSSRVTAGLGASWSKRNYRGVVPAASSLIVDDDLKAVFASLQLSVGRNASLGLDARREVRNTNLTIFDYTAYRVGITATQSF